MAYSLRQLGMIGFSLSLSSMPLSLVELRLK